MNIKICNTNKKTCDTNIEICKNNGNLTVEASIIIPAVLFSILLLAHVALILYCLVYLRCTADNAARNGADAWISEGDMATGELPAGHNSHNLYRSIYDPRAMIKKENVKKYIEESIDECFARSLELRDINVELKNYIFFRRLDVEIRCVYKIPVLKLLRFFGIEEGIVLCVDSCAVINYPAELVRNIDFAVEIENRLDIVDLFKDKLDKFLGNN